MDRRVSFGALILAAGYSSRMGTFKPLLPLGGVPAVERLITCFREAGVSNIKVVVGSHRERIIPILDALEVEIVVNPDFDKGMFSSVQAGVASFDRDTQAFFLQPVDCPLVRSTTVRHILRTGVTYPGTIIYPTYDGRRGHPPLISMRYRQEILQEGEQGNLQEVLGRHETDAILVPVNDEAILLDMDTQQDYQTLQRFLEERQSQCELERQSVHLT